MADYVSQWSGPLIDTGINLALNGIGCKKYPDATLDRPLDLNKLHDQIQLSSGESISANGSWLVDFYINGPVLDLSSINSTNYTPIQIDVYTANNFTYQSLMADGVFYYRYAPIGEDLTMDWLMVAYPRLENDVSPSGAYIQVNDPRVELVDLLFLIIRVKNDIQDNATLKLNQHATIPIYTSDSQPLSEGIIAGSIIPLVYSKVENRFYLTGGGGTKWIQVGLDGKADKADPPITTNVNKAMTKVTVNEQGIVTKVERATTSDIDHDGSPLDELISEISQTIIVVGDSGIKFTTDGSVTADWGTIPVE